MRGGPLALGLLAAAAAAPVAWPAPVAIPLLALVLGYAPGALAAPHLVPRAGAAERTLFALAVAPFLAGAAMAASLALGVPAATGARAILAGVAVAGLVLARWPSPGPPPSRRADGPIPWLAAASWTAGVAVMLLVNPWLVHRSDGWFHAAVVLQMSERPIPPEDPYFAGLRLLYFWGYHAWAVLWLAVAPRIGVWAPLIAANLAGAAAVMLGVSLIARRLGATARGTWLAAGVAALGYAPFAWIWIAVRTFAGEVQGAEELRRLLSGGVSPPLQIMSNWMLHSSMAFFGDKFLVITPFALGLAQFALGLLLLLDFIARPGLRAGLALGMAVAAALFVHSVVGWSVAMVAGAWWWWALWRSRKAGERRLREVLLPLPVVFAAVVAVLSPYLAATTFGKVGTLAPGFSPGAVATWLLSGLLIVPAGMGWLWWARRREGALDLLVFAGTLTVAGLSIWLPGQNQTKFFNLLLLLLAAPAGIGLDDLARRLPNPRRALLAAGLLLAVVPTLAFAVWAFATERGQLAEAWEHPSPGILAGMRWARDHTPPDAIVVDAQLALDFPVRAGRSAITGGPSWERNWRYSEHALRMRREAAVQLGALGPWSDAVHEFLDGLGRPVLVIRRRPRDAGPPGWREELAPHPGYRLVYGNDEIAIFRWDPGP